VCACSKLAQLGKQFALLDGKLQRAGEACGTAALLAHVRPAVDTLQLAGGLAIGAICSREDAEGPLEGAALLMGSGRLCLEGLPHASGNGEDIESGLLLAGAHLQAACHLLQAIDRHRPGLDASAAVVARIIRPAAAAPLAGRHHRRAPAGRPRRKHEILRR
jgi:hypothetical protein